MTSGCGSKRVRLRAATRRAWLRARCLAASLALVLPAAASDAPRAATRADAATRAGTAAAGGASAAAPSGVHGRAPTGEVRSPPSDAPGPSASIGLGNEEPRAGAPHRLRWRWARFDVIDYWLTASLTAGYLAVELAGGPPDEPRWRGGILFDDAVRSVVVARTRGGRDGMAVASDVFALLPQLMMVIDSALVPLVTDHGNLDVAWQLSLIAARAEALTGLLSRAGHFYVARERPDAAPCRRDAEYGAGCFRGSSASFPGGHVAGATIGAGIVCMHHWHLPLYGAGAWNVVPCGVGLVSAALAGYTRMAADRHYASDTLVGVALGASAGFLLPWLTYRRPTPEPDQSRVRWMLTPLEAAGSTGLGVRGWF